MPLKNYTTKVPANRSVQEIQVMLQKHGAIGVLMEYEKETGRIASLAFKIDLKGQSVGFRLPLKWREAEKVLQKQGVKRAFQDEDYVYRVSWRIMRDWVDIQMAIIELEMVKIEQVFLPYVIGKNGKTFGENILDNPQLLLN